MADPLYFAENYIKIVNVDKGLMKIALYPYQKNILKAFDEHRHNIVLSCRQSGKCVTYDTIITLRNNNYNSGQPFSMKIGQFYEWIAFRKNFLF